jgi:excisionase family DNA binding protein
MKSQIKDDPSLIGSRVITAAEAADLLQCGLTRMYELLGDGSIRSYKDGSSRRVFLVSVLNYQAGQAAKGPELGMIPNLKRAKAKRRAA